MLYKIKYFIERRKDMEEKQLAEDLKFMRSMIERTHREIDPGAPIFITWGLICLIGYIVTHFLIAQQMYIWINRLWLSLYAVGFPLTFFFGYRIGKRQMVRGAVSYVSKQVWWVWMILIANGILWGTFGLGRNFFGDIGFLWAWIYGIGLSMTGVLYSKEWLFGGLGVFVGILAAVFIEPYAYVVLGVIMCLGCTVPSVIALRRLRRLEKEDEQG